MAVWLQHIVLFAFIKVDRALASALPIGKYPLISVDVVHVIVGLTWVVSLTSAGLINGLFTATYEKAVLLCVPVLPVGFFIAIFWYSKYVHLVVGQPCICRIL